MTDTQRAEALTAEELQEVRRVDAEFWRVFPYDSSWDVSAEGQRARLLATLDAAQSVVPDREALREAVQGLATVVAGRSFGADGTPMLTADEALAHLEAFKADVLELVDRLATPDTAVPLDVERLAVLEGVHDTEGRIAEAERHGLIPRLATPPTAEEER